MNLRQRHRHYYCICCQPLCTRVCKPVGDWIEMLLNGYYRTEYVILCIFYKTKNRIKYMQLYALCCKNKKKVLICLKLETMQFH